MKVKQTNDGKKGGLLKGKPHYDKDGNPLGGIKAVVTDSGNRPVELEGGEVIINKAASKKHWKLLSKINQSAGGGVPIGPPSGAETSDEDPEEFKDGGKIIEFNPNHIPNKWVVQYAEKIKKQHPEIWKLGGNIFGNEAFENLLRVSKRGHWLDSEEWMYIKWRSYVARHIHDYRIEGVVAMLKWCDKVEKGWAYMKDLIEENIEKIEAKEKPAKTKMSEGGGVENQKDKRWLGWFVVTQNFRGDLVRWIKGELIKAEKSKEKGYIFIQAADVTVDAYDNIEDVDFNRITVPLNPTKHKRQFNYLKKIEKLGYVKPWETYSTSEGKKMAKGGGVDSIEPEGYKKEDAIKYGKKLVDANLKYIEIRNKIEENYAGLKSEIQEVLNSVLDYYDKRKPIKENFVEEDKTSSDRIDELGAMLLNQIKRYAKENYNEDVIDDTFMMKGQKNNEDFQVEEVTIDTKSGRGISITINELFMERGGELAKGIRAEMEHKKTIDKIYNRKVSKFKAPELIAKDHLKEDKKYYSKLEKVEGKKFATGSNIEKFDIGDKVYLNTKKGKIEVVVTKYSDKWVQFDDLTKGKSGRWKATPEFHEEFDSFVNQSTTTKTPTTQTTQPVQHTASNSTIIENLEVYNEDLGEMTWDEAIEKVKELGEGWRLPTKEEFEDRLYPNQSRIPNLKAKKNRYWSSTEFGDNAAWGFYFDFENAFNDYKNVTYYVRPVRFTDFMRFQPAQQAVKKQEFGLPSTDDKTWGKEYNVGDKVKIRYDFSNDYGVGGTKGYSKVDYFSSDNNFTITKINTQDANSLKRNENPSGKLYILSNGQSWEGKDLELVETTTQEPTKKPVKQAVKKQTKIEEPEPVKRKFVEGKDYLKIFTEYFEKENERGRVIQSDSYTKSIVKDFIIATEDIAGFSEQKLKEIKSYYDKE
jgi:Protein of unknown function (DUF1566)